MENNNLLISIVVITYNSSKYVLETLESVKAQTYRNIELIVSDDCSKDDTVEICKDWLEKNKDRFVRTELITVERNTGIAPNCNRGCKKAEGEWVKLIAGDDVFMKTCIEDNVSFIQKNNQVQILFSRGCCFWGSLDEYRANATHETERIQQIPFFYLLSSRDQMSYLINNLNLIEAPTGFMKRELLELCDYYNEQFPFIEDLPMWINLTQHGIKLYFMPKYTIFHRKGDSITMSSEKMINMNYYQSWLKFRSKLKYSISGYITFSIIKFQYYLLINIFKNKRNRSSEAVQSLFQHIIRMKLSLSRRFLRLKRMY
ncbi:MAG: glycosyltransferase family 2 protein [Prevotellaceae bacterium]|jgi:alpha-1,3-rhamnosyltransferase|nr:glycosyltransferase family 2 protein [Prevotellaceae bacterium]